MPAMTGKFVLELDSVPNASNVAGLITLGSNPASAAGPGAVQVRYGAGGTIDASNASAFAAVAPVPYTSGVSAHLRIAVDVAAGTYSVVVTPHGGNTLTLASAYAFAAPAASIADIAIQASAGSFTVSNVVLEIPIDTSAASPPPDTGLVLHVSADLYNGGPQIAVAVDGQATGTFTVTAHHVLGQVDDLAVPGSFSAQVAHQVQITFMNDAWDGTATTDGHDRNLYVEGLTLDAQTFAGTRGTATSVSGGLATSTGEVAMATNGTWTLSIAAPVPDAGSATSGGEVVGLAGKCLATNGNATTDGTAVVLWDCTGAVGQQWTLEGSRLVGPGGKCLDVTGSVSIAGTFVELSTCNGGPSQQWVLQGGQLLGLGGMCLDVRGASSANGTPIELWGCNGGSNQQWHLQGAAACAPACAARTCGDDGCGGSCGSCAAGMSCGASGQCAAPQPSTWGGTPDPNAIVIAPGGNDALACTVSAPCHSLERAQQLARSAADKTIYLRAGRYDRSQPIHLTSSDTGETWMTYPGDPVDSAVIDGAYGTTLIDLSGASHVTLNGLTAQHVTNSAIYADVSPRTSDITVENCDVSGTTQIAGGAAASGAIVLDNTTNAIIRNNYIHDTRAACISLMAFNAGESIEGGLVTGNVCLRADQNDSDDGAIYLSMRGTGTSGGHATVSNNFVRDWGAATATNDQIGIYLDDYTSNVTVTGNIIVPATGAITASDANNTAAVLVNGGVNNVITGNLIDLGSSARVATADIWQNLSGGAGNSQFRSNIVISKFTGGLLTSSSGVGGYAYYQGGNANPPASAYDIRDNLYFNYAGGQTFSNGQRASDSNPVRVDPQLSGITYSLAATSPALAPPVSFTPIAGNWGPPGFVIPPGSAPSSPH
jgi:hypothetical protein